MLQQAFQFRKSQPASITTVSNGRMVSPSCLGSQGAPWPGMSRLQPHWRNLTSQLLLLLQELQLKLQPPGRKSNTLISQPRSHFSRSLLRHWDRSTNLLLTSSASWAVGSPPNFMKSDRPRICSRQCQSRCNDIMQLFCTTAFHQDRTSGHQWISF